METTATAVSVGAGSVSDGLRFTVAYASGSERRYNGSMLLMDLTLPTPAENLALDEALLLEAEAGRGGEVLRFWEWPHPAVVLGSGGVLKDDVNEEACECDGVPILRRSSGGGTVLLGKGCLCYTLVLSYDSAPELSAIRPSYDFILSRVAESLDGLVSELRIEGISDLTSGGFKFSGSSQQRKRSHLLHHGTLLYAFDLSLLPRYLREPPRQPDYRAGRDHLAFVRNLTCSPDELRNSLRTGWQADEQSAALPTAEVQRLASEKYTSPGWNRRR
jgi:lipoate-protein ligase A